MKKILFIISFQFAFITAYSQLSFEPIGPEGSSIVCFAEDSVDNMYCGGEKFYMSTDGGNNWVIKSKNSDISSIALNKDGDAFIIDHNIFYKSTDHGLSWNQTGSGIFGGSRIIKIDSMNMIYVGTHMGLYKSTDNGSSFKVVNNVNDYTSYPPQMVNDILFADGRIFAASDYGIFKSTDGGNKWTQFYEFINVYALKRSKNGDYFAASYAGIFRSTDKGDSWVNVAPPNDIQYLIISNDTDIYYTTFNFGIYKSTDNGVSWNQMNNGLHDNNIRTIFSNSENQIFISTAIEVYKSSNNGADWIPKNYGLDYAPVADFKIDSNGDYFAATIGGVFKSTNKGNNWNIVNNGLSNTQLNLLFISPQGTLFCSGFAGKSFRSTDHGNTWQETNIENFYSMAFTKNGSILVGKSGNILRSTDNGDSWDITFDDNNYGPTSSFVIDTSGNVYGAQGSRIIYSTDDGQNWDELYRGFYRINDFVISGMQYMYAIDDYGVFRSTNLGESWTTSFTAPYNNYCQHAAINSNGIIYASINTGTIFKSNDSGYNWTEAYSSDLLSNFKIRRLFIDPSGYLYVINNDNGILKSTKSTVPNIPNIVFEPYLNFGKHKIPVKLDTVITISNIGIDTLKLAAFSDNPLLTLKDTLLILPPYGIAEDSVTYFLTLPGSQEGKIILKNSSNLIDTIYWSAAGYELSAINFSKKSVDLGNIDLHDSFEKVISITNPGEDTLKILKTEILPSVFRSNILNGIIPPGQSLIDTLKFTPEDSISYLGIQVFYTNTFSQCDTIYLFGRGNPLPTLKLDNRTIHFNATLPGAINQTYINLINENEATLRISRIIITDTLFNISRDSLDIVPGSFFKDTLIYKPLEIGKDSALLFIYSNSIKGIDTVYLYGICDTVLTSVGEERYSITYLLDQNYPNPFNPTTTINYQIPEAGWVMIKIYDVLGREIRTLVNEEKKSGRYQVKFNAADLASGIYLYKMQAGNFVSIKKLILMK
ncbi:MAG: T9SS type A sorting domain-containing protein [Ignavibacteria bacterium]